jgi:hypothetical protein
MLLPMELIHLIYNYSNIESKLLLHKIFNHQSFIHKKIYISDKTSTLLNQTISFKYTNFIVLKELSDVFFLN